MGNESRSFKYESDAERTKAWAWLIGSNDRLKADALAAGGRRSMTEAQVEYLRIGTELMLENTMKQIAESTDRKLLSLSPEKFYEELDTSAIIPFTRFSLPIVRRVMPRLYARSLVGFQPMPMPTGKIFYLNFTRGTSKFPVVAGERLDQVNKMFGARNYGGARSYDYFPGTNTNPQVVTLKNYGAKNTKVLVDGVQIAANLVTVTPGGVGGTPATADTVSIAQAVAPSSTILVVYDNVSEGQVAADIEMSMDSKNIEAEAIKLRSAMTVETMQDFAAYHGISSEQELTAAMAAEVDREIDLNIIDRLYKGATGGNVNWDANGYMVGDDNTFFRREYRKTLYEAIVATSNMIYRKRFVDATWIVGGVGAIERLEKLERFVVAADGPDDASISRKYQGTLDGKWDVYKDARLQDDQLLMGFRGDTPFQTGAIYAPYIPAYMTDLLPDPNINFKVRKGLMSRFGFSIVVPDCYATLTIL